MVVLVNKKTTAFSLPLYYKQMKDQTVRNKPDKLYSEIGKKISKYRKELKITQLELAQKVGVSQQLITAFENGTRRIPLQTLKEIADVLYLDVRDLLPVKDDKHKPGPSPKVKQQYEKLLELPEREQQLVLDMINTLHAKYK